MTVKPEPFNGHDTAQPTTKGCGSDTPACLSSVSFLFDISTCNKTYLEYIILTWLMLKCLAYRIDSRTDTSHACDLVQNSYKLSPRVERKV